MYKGIYRLKPSKDRYLRVLAVWLNLLHVNANAITGIGLVSGLLAAVCLYSHLIPWGVVFILVSVFADLLDGVVARISKKESLRGKLFDAISDRIVEISWVGVLVYRNFIPWWGLALPIVSVMLLLNRLWAHYHRITTSFIIVARFERVAAILGIIILPWHWLTYSFLLGVIVCTLFANLQIIQKIFMGFLGLGNEDGKIEPPV